MLFFMLNIIFKNKRPELYMVNSQKSWDSSCIYIWLSDVCTGHGREYLEVVVLLLQILQLHHHHLFLFLSFTITTWNTHQTYMLNCTSTFTNIIQHSFNQPTNETTHFPYHLSFLYYPHKKKKKNPTTYFFFFSLLYFLTCLFPFHFHSLFFNLFICFHFFSILVEYYHKIFLLLSIQIFFKDIENKILLFFIKQQDVRHEQKILWHFNILPELSVKWKWK